MFLRVKALSRMRNQAAKFDTRVSSFGLIEGGDESGAAANIDSLAVLRLRVRHSGYKSGATAGLRCKRLAPVLVQVRRE